MKILRNVPTLLWWVASLGLLIHCHYVMFVIALMLMCAAPMKKYILGRVWAIDDMGDMQAVASVTKVGALDMMTQMTVVKSMMYADKRPKRNPEIRMLDISPRKETK